LFILLFALGCLLSSAHGLLSGARPFGVVELILSGVACVDISGRLKARGRDRVQVEGP
jgi:hypothetical protein